MPDGPCDPGVPSRPLGQRVGHEVVQRVEHGGGAGVEHKGQVDMRKKTHRWSGNPSLTRQSPLSR